MSSLVSPVFLLITSSGGKYYKELVSVYPNSIELTIAQTGISGYWDLAQPLNFILYENIQTIY